MKHIAVLCIYFTLVASQTCYFDFEDPSELDNFITDCNGVVGTWTIVDRPTIPPPPPTAGERLLTSKKPEEMSCMRTVNTITVRDKQTVLVDLYAIKRFGTLYFNLEIKLICKDEEIIWSLDNYINAPAEGEWQTLSHEFTPLVPECQVEIKLYKSTKDVNILIDKITFLDPPPSSDCYIVPKPTTTTEDPTTTTEVPTTTTEDPTTTTEDPTTTTEDPTTTTEDPTTTTEDPTTTTEDPITTTEDPTTTTEVQTTTTEVQTSTTEDPITTTESPITTTVETTTTTEGSTTTTEDSTTTTEDTTTTTNDPTTKIEPTATTEEPGTTTEPSISSTEEPTSYDDYTTQSVYNISTTEYPSWNNSGFSAIYMVIIIAVSGGIAILSACVCFLAIIICRPKKHKTISDAFD